MNRHLLLAALSLGISVPAFAQHQGHETPPTPAPQQQPAAPVEQHGQHDHGDTPPVATPEGRSGDAMADAGIDPPEAGNDAPPDAPDDFLADRYFSPTDMHRARGILNDEHGNVFVSKLMSNVLEYQNQNGEDGYRWDAEAWFGGDIDRLVLKTEGEGGRSVDNAEIQVLYSRAWDHVTDLQFGIRQDIEPNPSRTYLVTGFETLLPYWFEAEGALFVGQRGQVLGRLGGAYDMQLTQRLVLQPRAELNFAAKSDSGIGLGTGLSDAELGLRLRYEFQREFAPYLGVSWERKFGDTAAYARADGERAETTSFVVGLRAWY